MLALPGFTQINPDLLRNPPQESGDSTIPLGLNMDAVFRRPFLYQGKVPVSLGGYAEMHYAHMGTDGISEGHQMTFRRMSIFMASSVSKKIKFLSEIEFENNPDEQKEGKPMEISIEYAAVDIEWHPLFTLRTGVILNPIGCYNQNHDGPRWEFVDKPVSSTELLPTTFSNTGVGFYGKHYNKTWMWAYEAYVSGGFDPSIIDNDKNRTRLAQAKENPARLSTWYSGTPTTTLKFSLRHKTWGELGFSGLRGRYTQTHADGVMVDDKRYVQIVAIDYSVQVPKLNTKIVTEWSRVHVQVPENYNTQFSRIQWGGFVDVVQAVWQGHLGHWEKSTVSLALRGEYVDWNRNRLFDVDRLAGDEFWAITPAISLRPQQETVIRLNYAIRRQRDFLGNIVSKTGGIQLGLSTYF